MMDKKGAGARKATGSRRGGMLVRRHRDQSKVSRYFYVVGWIRLAEEDERIGAASYELPQSGHAGGSWTSG